MPKKRTDIILDIMEKEGFVTVKYLCDELHYSTATINRDLNDLQKKGLIKRSYGGAEIVASKYSKLLFRQHKMKREKSRLAQEAAKLVSGNMTIFIDGSTTAHYLGKYITNIQSLTVITNNLNLCTHLSEEGVRTICLGGKVLERPYITAGVEAAEQAASYSADVAFFSTGCITQDGIIKDVDGYAQLHKQIVKNSKKAVYIADHKKIDVDRPRILFDLSQVDVVVTDYIFSDEVKAKFPNTEFVEVAVSKQDD